MDKGTYRKKLTLIFMGRSGCGKGTQAKYALARLKKLGVSHLETGLFLRQLVGRYHNPTTELARTIMNQGGFVPPWFPVFPVLKKMMENGIIVNHWIVDGSPRRVWEAELIDDIMLAHRRTAPIAVHIELSSKEATKRLILRAKTEGRSDDTKRAIQNRMKSFSKHTVPILRYYKKTDRLITVKGDQLQEKVWKEINAALGKRFKKYWPRENK